MIPVLVRAGTRPFVTTTPEVLTGTEVSERQNITGTSRGRDGRRQLLITKCADRCEGRTGRDFGPVKQTAVIWFGELKRFDATPDTAAH